MRHLERMGRNIARGIIKDRITLPPEFSVKETYSLLEKKEVGKAVSGYVSDLELSRQPGFIRHKIGKFKVGVEVSPEQNRARVDERFDWRVARTRRDMVETALFLKLITSRERESIRRSVEAEFARQLVVRAIDAESQSELLRASAWRTLSRSGRRFRPAPEDEEVVDPNFLRAVQSVVINGNDIIHLEGFLQQFVTNPPRLN